MTDPATRGIAGGSVTAASRGALLAMMPSLAVELVPRKIRVNAVNPGPARSRPARATPPPQRPRCDPAGVRTPAM